MRARYPDLEGFVEHGGTRLGYEVFGDGADCILFMPTWTIVHSRVWKMQVPYFARHHRVITFDGPGNGRSDRVTDPSRYSADLYSEYAVAVLDECRVSSAFVVGLSLGGLYAIRLASLHPDRVAGLVLIGPALPIAEPVRGRERIPDDFDMPYPENPRMWEKYNRAYWHDHYPDFVDFFFGEMFPEPHSTKPREDAEGWALETTPQILAAERDKPPLPVTVETLLADITCPTLVIHGTDDRIISHDVGEEAARLTGGTLVSLESSGHGPMARDPVKVNRVIREFVVRNGS